MLKGRRCTFGLISRGCEFMQTYCNRSFPVAKFWNMFYDRTFTLGHDGVISNRHHLLMLTTRKQEKYIRWLFSNIGQQILSDCDSWKRDISKRNTMICLNFCLKYVFKAWHTGGSLKWNRMNLMSWRESDLSLGTLRRINFERQISEKSKSWRAPEIYIVSLWVYSLISNGNSLTTKGRYALSD